MDNWFRSSCDKSKNRLMLWFFTDSDHDGCLKTRKSTSSSKLFFFVITSCVPPAPRKKSHRLEFRVFYALVKGTSAGFGADSMLKDLVVDISKKHLDGQSSTGSES